MTAKMANRNKEIARIHCLKRDLALSDDEYRDILFVVCRVRSSADLDYSARARLIEHLASRVPKARQQEWAWVNNASADRQPMLRKIIMQLKTAGCPKVYADGMARHMFHVDRVEFCAPDQLLKIIAALIYDQRRRAGGKGAT